MPLITKEAHTFLSSTTVREIASLGGDVSSMVPPHVSTALRNRFHELGEGQQIVPKHRCVIIISNFRVYNNIGLRIATE